MSERPPIQRWWVSYFVVGALAVVLVLVAFMLILTVLAPLSRVILLVMFGVIVAFLLAPLVELLQRPLRRRGLAIGLGATAALVVLIGGLALLAVPLVRETRELAEAAPRYAAMLSSDEPINVLGIEISGEVRERIGREIGDRASEWSEIAARTALRLAGGLVDVIFVLVLGVYLLASGPAVRRWLLDLVPADRRADAARVEARGVECSARISAVS